MKIVFKHIGEIFAFEHQGGRRYKQIQGDKVVGEVVFNIAVEQVAGLYFPDSGSHAEAIAEKLNGKVRGEPPKPNPTKEGVIY